MPSTRWPPPASPPPSHRTVLLHSPPASTSKQVPLHNNSPSPATRKHTKSLGLLSPIPSLSSLTCPTPTRQSKRYPFSLQKGSQQPQTPTRILSLSHPPQSPTTVAMSLEIEIQQPAPHMLSSHILPSPPSDFRPSSRSEMLLRSTLLKDDLQTSPRAKTHKRRHSNFARPSNFPEDDEEPESLAATLLFRTCSGSSSSFTPRIYGADSDFSSGSSKSRPSTPRRPSSPASPVTRRPSATLTRSSTEGSLPSLSPHEQVLRARLEKVLGAAELRGQTPTPKRQKRASGSSNHFGWTPWREEEDSDDIYAPYSRTQALSSSSSQSISSNQSAFQSSATSSKPSSSRIRAASMPQQAGDTFLRLPSPQQQRGWSDGAMTTLRAGQVHEEENEDRLLITPPPSPPTRRAPLSPRRNYGGMSPRHVPLPMTPQTKATGLPPNPPTPSFDAKMAAERLRKIEGYVSFANVEGLGIPPEDVEEDTTKHRRWFLF